MSILGKNAADTAVGDYVKAAAGFCCELCHRYFGPKSPELDAAHFFPRGNATRGVRYDPDNLMSLCRDCHQKMAAHPAMHATLLIRKIGQKRFDALNRRAHQEALRRDENVSALARHWRGKTAREFGFYRGRGPALSTFVPEPVA